MFLSRILYNNHKLQNVINAFKSKTPTSFGIILDIDGVIFRGKELLPFVKDAFSLLTDKNNKFKVPTIFLTNGSHSLRLTKAKKLSEALGITINEDQVIMAHSPLRLFNDLHDKHVLMVGQGPVIEIGTSMGFKKISTLSDISTLFPYLDCVDFKRRRLDPRKMIRTDYKPIEAIICLGEPLKWESALQLLIDVLITNGDPGNINYERGTVPYSHLPIIACNLDLLWMAEIGLPLPRFGHGIFLTLLETLYKKLTGFELNYSAILGKPTEISYMHAAYCIQKMAFNLNLPPVKTLYVIGDNPESDILGANLFNRYLNEGGLGRFDHTNLKHFEEEVLSFDMINSLKECIPVLVESGVYDKKCLMNGFIKPVSLLMEDLTEDEKRILRTTKHVETNLYEAIKNITDNNRN